LGCRPDHTPIIGGNAPLDVLGQERPRVCAFDGELTVLLGMIFAKKQFSRS